MTQWAQLLEDVPVSGMGWINNANMPACKQYFILQLQHDRDRMGVMGHIKGQ